MNNIVRFDYSRTPRVDFHYGTSSGKSPSLTVNSSKQNVGIITQFLSNIIKKLKIMYMKLNIILVQINWFGVQITKNIMNKERNMYDILSFSELISYVNDSSWRLTMCSEMSCKNGILHISSVCRASKCIWYCFSCEIYLPRLAHHNLSFRGSAWFGVTCAEIKSSDNVTHM
jgi:hypothetical protein